MPTNPEKINPRFVAAAESRQLNRILALLGGPRAARGRLRRRPPSAAAALRAVGLASLGLAELRKCLIRGKHRRMQSRQGGQGRQGRQGSVASEGWAAMKVLDSQYL